MVNAEAAGRVGVKQNIKKAAMLWDDWVKCNVLKK